MKILTIRDLKNALKDFQELTGKTDDAPIVVAVQARTQAWPSDYPQIWTVDTTHGGDTVCLHVTLAEGITISKHGGK